MHEYNVRFGKSNERFQIAQKDRKERIAEYLENICTARKSRLNNYGVEPTIINGDKMLLHRNESSSEKNTKFDWLRNVRKRELQLIT